MSVATTYPNYSGIQNGLRNSDSSYECACTEEVAQEGNFFRGIFVAVPAGLVLWFGLLKLATIIVHHI